MMPRYLPDRHPFVREPFRLFEAVAGYMQDRQAAHGEPARPRRTLLASSDLRERLRQRYEEYRECLARDLPCDSFSESEREALFACYGQAEALRSTKRAILAAQPHKFAASCPYCAVAPIGEKWDHYLPRNPSDYPEYSIFAANLVPSCGRCNELKGTIVRAANERVLIHFYYDSFDPSECFLDASIVLEPELDGLVPVVSFEVSALASASAFGRFYERHCKRLQLLSFYKSKAREYVGAIPGQLRRRERLGPPEAIVSALEELAANCASDLGSNHPQAAVYRAAARSQDFIEYCRISP